MIRSETHRLFLALWPGAGVRDRLGDLLPDVTEGRRIPPDDLHLTLVFLGAVGPASLRCLEERLSDLVFEPFDLVLDRFGYFAGPRILWLGPSRVPAGLVALREQLRLLCIGCEIRLPGNDFVPHVSLFRNHVDPEFPRAGPVVEWHVDRLVLVESGCGGSAGSYRVLREQFAQLAGP